MKMRSLVSAFLATFILSVYAHADTYSDIKSVTWTDSVTNSYSRLASQIPAMKAAGFNTIYILVPWGVMNPQPLATPPVYNDQAFASLKQIFDLLRANNMKVLMGINQFGGIDPAGIDHCNWVADPVMYRAFETYSAELLNRLSNYSDMVYPFVFTEGSEPCSYAYYPPDPRLVPLLQSTLGSWPTRLPPAVRLRFKLGYQDYSLIALNWGNGQSPVASPNPYDFMSLSAYGMDGMTDAQIASTLATRTGYFKSLYPSLPLILGESGAKNCSPYSKDNQARVDLAYAQTAKSMTMGINIWQWMDPDTTVIPCDASADAIHARDGSSYPAALALSNFFSGGAPLPSVSLTSPSQGALVANSVLLSANASATLPIARIEFYADATLLGSVTSPPYNYAWATNPGMNGTHVITAKVYDSVGNSNFSQATVVVNNLPPSSATSPVAWFRMDESGGSVFTDSSGNNEHGSYYGAIGLGSAGKVNSSAHFSGAAETLADADKVPRFTSAFTAMAWVKTENPGFTDDHTIMGAGRRSWGSGWGLYVNLESQTLIFRVNTDNADSGNEVTVTVPYSTPDSWHHVAATYNGTSAMVYIDGQLAGSSGGAGPVVYRYGERFTVATTAYSHALNFKGSIDDIRLFSLALTQAQIQSLQNPNQSGSVPVINSPASASGAVGQPFSYQITTQQNNATSYSATTLPTGLSMNAAGTISGTPTTPTGSPFTVTLTASNNVGPSQPFTLSITISNGPNPTVPPLIVSASAAQGVVGQFFSYQISTQQNNATSYSASAMPAGLSFQSGSGLMSGTPTTPTASPFNVTLTASNSAGTSPPFTLAITITTTPSGYPPVLSGGLPVGTIPATASTLISLQSDVPAFCKYSRVPDTIFENMANTMSFIGNSHSATVSVTPGVNTFYIRCQNQSDGIFNREDFPISFTVAGSVVQAPVITSALTLQGTVGQALTPYRITATNGPNTYSVIGSLPAGLSFNGVDQISGTPTTAGGTSVSIKATNSGGSDTKTLVITINAAPTPAPVITSALTLQGTVGQALTPYRITATNGPNTYSVIGSLPAGLSFNGVDQISGTPTTAGGTSVSIKATNSGGSDTKTLVITINAAPTPAPVITSPLTLQGTVGQVLPHYQITATNGPNTFSVTGTLPAGISFNGIDKIAGTPTAATPAGGTSVSITATNGSGSDIKTLVITISPAQLPPPAITSALTLQGTVGQAITPYRITATNGPNTFAITGTLPPGLSFDGVDQIIGTPTAATPAGGTSVTLKATNVGGSDTKTFVITIDAPPTTPVITSALTAQGTVGQPFTPYRITATNGPNTFTLTGLLPAGLIFDGIDQIVGTPTAATPAGGTSVTLKATDASGASDTKTLVISIFPGQLSPPLLAPAGGSFVNPIQVSMNVAAFGAVLRYTTDGQDPTDTSTPYSAPVTVDHTLTLKVRAFQTGWLPSAVVSADYVIGSDGSGGSLPKPKLRITDFMSVTSDITADYSGPSTGFNWLIAPAPGGSQATLGSQAGGTPIPTRIPRMHLSDLQLTPGAYTISVQAVNGTQFSPYDTALVTLVSAQTSDVKIYPNPWRASNPTSGILFSSLPSNATVKIFDLAGHHVRTLIVSGTSVEWNLQNESGQAAASGVYLYVITDVHGNRTKGKVGLIR